MLSCQSLKSALTDSKAAAKRRRIYHVSITSAPFSRALLTLRQACECNSGHLTETNWRKRVRVERTGDTKRCRPPVLKITRWVLIGSENSLLYSILCALSRDRGSDGFCFVLIQFGPWIYHVFITALTVWIDTAWRADRAVEKWRRRRVNLAEYTRCSNPKMLSFPINHQFGDRYPTFGQWMRNPIEMPKLDETEREGKDAPHLADQRHAADHGQRPKDFDS